MPLATALVDDDLVLIASVRGVLEQALDVSQIPELNQAGQASFQEGLRRLGTGAALVQAAPGALERWLGLPLPVPPDQRPGGLLLALQPEGRSLRLSGLLGLPPETVLPEVGADGALGRALLTALHRPTASLPGAGSRHDRHDPPAAAAPLPHGGDARPGRPRACPGGGFGQGAVAGRRQR